MSDLLHRLRSSPDDERLWTSVYRRLHRQVYVLTFRLCDANSDLAQDLTQETFLRFISAGAITKVETDAGAVAYLRAIARNLVHDHYRKHAQHPTVSTEAVAADDLERALNAAIRRTLTEEDFQVLPGLRADDRDLLRRIIEGYSVGEIAASMALTYSAAAVRIHRLRKYLRTMCKESAPDGVLVSKEGAST